jgi:LmbE family N-acetylglucosaminyl deacetylase
MLTKRVVSRQERFLKRLIKRRRKENEQASKIINAKKVTILEKIKKRMVDWDARNREVEAMPVIKKSLSKASIPAI